MAEDWGKLRQRANKLIRSGDLQLHEMKEVIKGSEKTLVRLLDGTTLKPRALDFDEISDYLDKIEGGLQTEQERQILQIAEEQFRREEGGSAFDNASFHELFESGTKDLRKVPKWLKSLCEKRSDFSEYRDRVKANLEAAFLNQNVFLPCSKFDKKSLRDFRNHNELMCEVSSLRTDFDSNRELRILVPSFTLRALAVLLLMKDYFQLPKIRIQTTEVSKTAVTQINRAPDCDFMIGAPATLLLSGAPAEQSFYFAYPIFKLSQRIVLFSRSEWDPTDTVELTYLEGATGQLDYLRAEANKNDYELQPNPKKDLDEYFEYLATAKGKKNMLISMWNPALRYHLSEQNVVELGEFVEHPHLIGIFANEKVWRGSDKSRRQEKAFYWMFYYCSLMMLERSVSEKYLSLTLNEHGMLNHLSRLLGK